MLLNVAVSQLSENVHISALYKIRLHQSFYGVAQTIDRSVLEDFRICGARRGLVCLLLLEMPRSMQDAVAQPVTLGLAVCRGAAGTCCLAMSADCTFRYFAGGS